MPSSNEPRDQLAALLRESWEEGGSPAETAGYLLDRGWRPPPRVIEDRSELDTLRPGTLVREKIGAQRAWELNSVDLVGAYKAAWWTQPGSRSAYKSGQLQLPVVVLWEPEEAAGEPSRIDVTHVAPGELERMARSGARPSPELRAAIDRARDRKGADRG